MYLQIAFSALTLLVGRQEGHPACKKLEWWGTGVVICLDRDATCIWPSWCHCHSMSLASVKSTLISPFWYRMTRVVPEKGPLNVCVCVCVCVCACVRACVCACVCVMYLQNRRHRCGKWNWLIIDWLVTPRLAGVLFSPPFVCAFVCWVVTIIIIIIIIMVASPARDIASLHHHVHDRLHTPPVVNRITQNVIGVDFLKRNLKIVGQRWVDYISEVIRDIFLA